MRAVHVHAEGSGARLARKVGAANWLEGSVILSTFKKRSPFSDTRFRNPSWIEHEAFTHGLPMSMVKAKLVMRTKTAAINNLGALDFGSRCVDINTVLHALQVMLRKDKPHYYKLSSGWRVLVPVKE